MQTGVERANLTTYPSYGSNQDPGAVKQQHYPLLSHNPQQILKNIQYMGNMW